MDSLQDVQNTTPPALDPQQYAQYQSAELTFSSVITHAEGSIAPGHTSHLPPPVSSMFPPDLDHTNSLSMAMQLPPADVSAMDVMPAPLPERAFGSGMLSEFPGQPGPSFQQDPQMNGIESHDPSHQLLSSPSATTASTSASHASSPAMNGMVPAYAIGSSSLATALDGPRSRSGSSASPGHLSNTSSDIGFSSNGSLPSTTTRESTFAFQAGFEGAFSALLAKESSPDEDDQQRQLLHNVLKQSVSH